MRKLTVLLLCLFYALSIGYIPNGSFGYNKSYQNTSNESYDLLIIADEKFVGVADEKFNDLADYADWKINTENTNTKCVSLQDIGVTSDQNSSNKIRGYIQNEHEKNDVEYVFLVGDSDAIECKKGEVTIIKREKGEPDLSITEGIPTDYFYSRIDNDFETDIKIGRLPVKNISELKTYIKNVKEYRESSIDKKLGILFSSGILDIKIEVNVAIITAGMIDNIEGSVPLTNSNNNFEYLETISSDSKKLEIDKINTILADEKPTFLSLLVHGDQNHIGGVRGHRFTDRKPWFLYSVACKSNNFTAATKEYKEPKNNKFNTKIDDRYYNFGECLLLLGGKCVGFIGNTANGLYRYRISDLDFGVSHDYHREYFKVLTNSEQGTTIGDVFTASKNNLSQKIIDEPEGDRKYRWVYYSLNLLGDPSIKLKLAPDGSEDDKDSGNKLVISSIKYSNGTFHIKWSAPSQGSKIPTYYNIQYRDNPNYSWIPINGIKGNNKDITVTNTAKGTIYGFMVTAVYADGTRIDSEEARYTIVDDPTNPPPDDPPAEEPSKSAHPKPPRNLRYKITAGKPILTWEKPANYFELSGVKYSVFRTDVSTNISKTLTDDWGFTSWSDVTAQDCKTYTYSVKTTDSEGRPSPASNKVTVPLDSGDCKGGKKEERGEISKPSAPLDVTARYNGQGIVLDWNPPASNGGSKIEIYYVYYNIDGGEKELLGGFPNTQAVMKDPTKGRRYCFKVVAKNKKETGDPSNPPACVSTGSDDDNKQTVTRPDKPTGLDFDYNPLHRNLTLNWNPPLNTSGADKCTYELQIVYTSSGQIKQIDELTNTYYKENNVIPGNTYIFKVRAKNSAGFSDYATINYVIPNNPPLGSPKVSAYYDGIVINISWEPPSTGDRGIDRYLVYYRINSIYDKDIIFLDSYSSIIEHKCTIYKDIKKDSKYYIKIRTLNDDGSLGPFSDEVEVITGSPPGNDPDNKKTYWFGVAGSPYDGSKSKQPMDINVSNNFGYSVESSLAIDSKGYPHIAWTNLGLDGEGDIFYVKWNGKNWVTINGYKYSPDPELATSNADVSLTYGYSGRPSLALDQYDNPHIAWSEIWDENKESDIYYIKWDGSTWVTGNGFQYSPGGTSVANITSNIGLSYHPVLKLNSKGVACIAWFDNINNDRGWSVHYLTLSGTNWVCANGEKYNNVSCNSNVSKHDWSSTFPALDIDHHNNPHIVWDNESSPSGGSNISYVKWNGRGWVCANGNIYDPETENENISKNTGNSRNPQICLDNSDNPYITWSDFSRSDESEIMLVKWNGMVWVCANNENYNPVSGNANISKTLGDSYHPSLSVNSFGYPSVAWCDGLRFSNDNILDGEIYCVSWDGNNWICADGRVYDGSNSSLNVSNNASHSYRPSIFIDNFNRVHLSWQDGTRAHQEIFYVTTNPNIGTNSINPSPQESKIETKLNNREEVSLAQAVKHIANNIKITISEILKSITGDLF